ncbi:retrovirus-related pol polyprotein from transposon TNT 1-94, partial [Tanacetum coccineum]
DDEQAQDDDDTERHEVHETTQEEEDDDASDDDKKAKDDDDEEMTKSDNDGDDFVHPKLTTHEDEIIHEKDTDEDDSSISSSDEDDFVHPMRVASVSGKKYILVIVDDYSRFTWVKCLRSKDEAPVFIINFLKIMELSLLIRHCVNIMRRLASLMKH